MLLALGSGMLFSREKDDFTWFVQTVAFIINVFFYSSCLYFALVPVISLVSAAPPSTPPVPANCHGKEFGIPWRVDLWFAEGYQLEIFTSATDTTHFCPSRSE